MLHHSPLAAAARPMFSVIVLAFLISGCDSDGTTEPVVETGTLTITAATDGLVPDPDGYEVAVDGGGTVALASNGEASVELEAGRYAVTLSGQAANCVPTGLPERSVTVSANQTAQLAYEITCFRDPVLFERRQASDRVDLYVVDASGGPEVLMTDAADLWYSSAGQPTRGSAWNPERTHFVFSSTTESSFDYDLYVMALNKSEVFHLDQEGPQVDPKWAPDGSKLLFPSWGPGVPADLWVANADLSGPEQLTDHPGWAASGAWSPDGTRIALAIDPMVGPPSASIHVMNADGSGLVNVSNPDGTRPDDLNDWGPLWSPDGGTVVFERERIDGSPVVELWAVAPDGSSLRQLTDAQGEDQDRGATWSPDGSQLYFTRCASCAGEGGGAQDVWAMQRDGSDLRPVTTTGVDQLASFNAATTFAGSVEPGTELLTVSWETDTPRIFRMALDGTGRTALTSANASAEAPHWR